MGYRTLFLLVEGSDDERFCERILKNLLKDKYNNVQILKYANEPDKRKRDFLRAIQRIDADYLILKDINNSPCITDRKEKISNKYGQIVGKDKIFIVIQEIESWYLAGLDEKNSSELRVKIFNSTDDIKKEQFNKIIPNRFDSRNDFMIEILNRYSIDTAKTKNNSFNYTFNKINLM